MQSAEVHPPHTFRKFRCVALRSLRALAHLPRREFAVLPQRGGEMALAGEAAGNGDLGNGQVCRPQEWLRVLETEADEILVRGLAEGVSEGPEKVPADSPTTPAISAVVSLRA